MERYIICPSCKDHNTLDSNFCKTCGTQLIFFNEKPSSKAKQNPISHDAAVTIITAEYSYEGQSINNAANGKGKGVFRDGKVYVGEWKNGVIHGKGEMRYPNGDVYSGEWNNNQICGQGVCQYQDGRKYNGHWKNNQKDGKGVFTWPNGDKYDGYWVKDQFSGIGTYYYADGKKYCGDWLNHKKNGKGIMTWANGSSYDGAWENDNISGIGTYTYADGAKYTGEWKNNKRHGKGILLESNGESYEGEWLNGKRSGFGIMTYADGSKYEGQWENDQKQDTVVLASSSKKAEINTQKNNETASPVAENRSSSPAIKSDTKPDIQAAKRRDYIVTFLTLIALSSLIAGVIFLGIAGLNKWRIRNKINNYENDFVTDIAETKYIQFIQSDPSLKKIFPPNSFDLDYDAFFDILKVLCKRGDEQVVRRYIYSITSNKEILNKALWVLGIKPVNDDVIFVGENDYINIIASKVINEMETIKNCNSYKDLNRSNRFLLKRLYSYSIPVYDYIADSPDPHTILDESFMMPSTALIIAACLGVLFLVAAYIGGTIIENTNTKNK